MLYVINKKYIAGLPQQAYRKGIGAYEMIVGHSTADDEASDENELSYYIKNWNKRKAFPHTFADWDSITELANPNYPAWGAGNSNSRAVHVELCQSKNKKKAMMAYARWIWTMAYYLFKRKLGVHDGVTLVSHYWVSKNLGGTNHSDPIGYLQRWGITWADVVRDVSEIYAAMASNDDVTIAIRKLEAAEIMKSPQYWLQNAKLGKMIRGDYAGQLLINLAGVGPSSVAITKLHNKGTIISPEYWLENAVSGKEVKGEYAGQLIINLASSIK